MTYDEIIKRLRSIAIHKDMSLECDQAIELLVMDIEAAQENADKKYMQDKADIDKFLKKIRK